MKRPSGPAPSVLAFATAPVEQVVTTKVSAFRVKLVTIASVALVLFIALSLLRGFPAIDRTADALRPRNSPSYGAVEEIKTELNRSRDPLWVITLGTNEVDVLNRLRFVNAALISAKSNGWISNFVLPLPLWPNLENQQANRAWLQKLVDEEPLLVRAALTNGFTPGALLMTRSILQTWRAALATSGVFWPSNQMSRWVTGNFMARNQTHCLSVGMVYPTTSSLKELRAETERWKPLLPRDNVIVSGWPLLGSALVAKIQENMWRVIFPMVLLVAASLWFAFRRAREILLSVGVMLLSGLALLAVMRLAGWSWNLLNMMAVPLILGTGVDYSIFTQLALRRHDGDVRLAYQSVGRALLLCGGTAVAGFGSLALSTNAGMSSLGEVCAIGIGFNMLISVYLLPIWWRAAAKIF
jgi:predicted exporter